MSHKIRHAIKNVLDELYTLGKGVKKGELQRKMEKLTNKRESHFIHSSTTKIRYERAMMTFSDYLEKQGIKRVKQLKRLSTEELQKLIDNYFAELAEKKYSKNTIKIHIAAMEKSFAIIVEDITRKEDIRKYLENDENRVRWWSAGEESRKRYPYANANAIIERLNEMNKMIAEAQRLGGFRVREIARAEVNREEHKIIIHSGKGGRTRELYFEHRKEDFERLVELVEKLKEQNYEKRLKEYYKDLRNAAKATGQEYSAAHAFRHEYAERRIEELKQNEKERRELIKKYNVEDKIKDKNDVEREADAVLTQELGHNRIKMSRYYYR
jgi:hypothetical protein